MASTITADTGAVSGSAGLKQSADSSGILALATGTGTTAVTIDASQNVGIGTAPSSWSAAYKALQLPNGAVFANDGSQSAYVGQNWYGNSGNRYISTAAASLYAQGSGAHIWYTAPSGTAGNTISFTQAMTLNANGNLSIQTANAGIVFNKTGALNNSTLNDYEEGTWTPNIGGNATYSGQIGVYTKIGRMVTIQCDMYINVRGTGSTTRIYGMPFSAAPGNFYSANVAYFSSLSANVFWIQRILPVVGTPEVYFETITSTLGQATANDASNIFQNGSRVIFTATYFTA